jgi:hypothetical protein
LAKPCCQSFRKSGTAWGVPAAVEPAVLFLQANAAHYLVGISVGIDTINDENYFKFKWL